MAQCLINHQSNIKLLQCTVPAVSQLAIVDTAKIVGVEVVTSLAKQTSSFVQKLFFPFFQLLIDLLLLFFIFLFTSAVVGHVGVSSFTAFFADVVAACLAKLITINLPEAIFACVTVVCGSVAFAMQSTTAADFSSFRLFVKQAIVLHSQRASLQKKI